MDHSPSAPCILSNDKSLSDQLRQVGNLRALILMGADGIVLILAFALAALLAAAFNELVLDRPYRDLIAGDTPLRLAVTLGLGGVLILTFHMKGHYTRRLSFWVRTRHFVYGAGLMLLLDGFMMFAAKESFSRLWLGLDWVLLACLLEPGRRMAAAILDRLDLWRLGVVVIGNGDEADAAVYALESEPELGYVIRKVMPLPQLRDLVAQHGWPKFYRLHRTELVVFALSGQDMLDQGEMMADLVRQRLPLAVIPPIGTLPVLNFDQHFFISQDIALLMGRNNLAESPARLIKWIFDRLVSALLLVLLAPLLALFSLIILSQGGGVIYGHSRVGRDGRPFLCYKFRTMVPGADCLLAQLLDNDPKARQEWTEFRKLKNDPRVTPFGDFLRRSSLDELPQLWNVLTGEMSLVGPRPVTQEELAFYGKDVSFYLETRPGITGLWQTSGRNDMTYDQRVRLDAWYVKNWSLWHDIAILIRTVSVVLRRVGAF